MPINGYSGFPKSSALLEPQFQIVLCHVQDTGWVESYAYAEIKSEKSADRGDWTFVVESYPYAETQSEYSAASVSIWLEHLKPCYYDQISFVWEKHLILSVG